MLLPGSNVHDSSLAGMIPLSLLLLKLTHHVGNVDTACGKSCSVVHKSTHRSAQTVNGTKQLSFGADSSNRVSKCVYLYLYKKQNTWWKYDDKWCELYHDMEMLMYRKCKGDNENIGESCWWKEPPCHKTHTQMMQHADGSAHKWKSLQTNWYTI